MCSLRKVTWEHSRLSGGLKNILLPKIISDTVSLCKDLGEKYLLVDQLCNIQDDAESKHGQIRDMDKIYGSVAFTTIIAINDRDGKGTPELAGRPRRFSIWWPPHNYQTGRGEVSPYGMSIINSSLWNNRDGHSKNE